MKSKITNLIKEALHNGRLIKYFIMACGIVLIELGAFQLIYVAFDSYVLATVGSFIIGVVLNWVFGRVFIFDKSHHPVLKEFSFILIASLVGLGIQLGVVAAAVQVLLLYPLIGKALSIIVSFFWNYWFRTRFIYKHQGDLV